MYKLTPQELSVVAQSFDDRFNPVFDAIKTGHIETIVDALVACRPMANGERCACDCCVLGENSPIQGVWPYRRHCEATRCDALYRALRDRGYTAAVREHLAATSAGDAYLRVFLAA